MGPSGRKRACCVTVSSLDRSRTTPGTPRGLLWGTNRRSGPTCCDWGGRGNTLRGCDLPLPVGEQKLSLPHRSFANHHPTRRPVPGVVFWYRHGGHSSPCWFVPPCLARAQGQKLTFPLCRTCVQEEQAKPMLSRNHYCSRSVADRTLRGTWCTPSWSKRWKRGTP